MIEQCEAKFKDRTFTSLLVMSELDIVSAFKARHSVRTFLPDFPSDKMNLVHHVVEDVNKMKVPFNSKVEIQVHGPGLGKMGAISHEAGWLLLKYDRNTSEDKVDQAITDACYLMQHIVMKLTQNAIATVWIVGTFSRKHAEQATPGFAVPGAVAFGEEAEKKHLMGSIINYLTPLKGKRYTLEQLFYNKDTNEFITEENAGDKLVLCSCLQSGPSAGNKQSWRFVIEGSEIHLFDSKISQYASYDMGIALANMELLMKLSGNIKFTRKHPEPNQSPLGGEYIMTCGSA